MHIDPSEALSKELVGFDKRQKLVILERGHSGQHRQIPEHIRSMFYGAARQLPDDERVTQNGVFFQQVAECG